MECLFVAKDVVLSDDTAKPVVLTALTGCSLVASLSLGIIALLLLVNVAGSMRATVSSVPSLSSLIGETSSFVTFDAASVYSSCLTQSCLAASLLLVQLTILTSLSMLCFIA